MYKIIDKIRFDGKHYFELKDPASRREVDDLVKKLRPLEKEIVAYENGHITIMPSGNVFSDSFPTDLASRISKAITGNPE